MSNPPNSAPALFPDALALTSEPPQAARTVDDDALAEVLVAGTVLVVPVQAGYSAAALVPADDQLLVLWVCDLPDGTALTNVLPRWPVIFETPAEAQAVASVCLRGLIEVGYAGE